MKSPTFVKYGLLGLFWRKESNNKALFAKLLRHCKLCTSFNILERLISENFLLRSRVPHAYVTQRVSSHSNERTPSFTELCTCLSFDACKFTWMVSRLVPKCAIISVNCIFSNHLRCCLTTLNESYRKADYFFSYTVVKQICDCTRLYNARCSAMWQKFSQPVSLGPGCYYYYYYYELYCQYR